MNVLEVKQVCIPEGYFRIVVKQLNDIPTEEETVGYQDLGGDVYVFCEGGVYICERKNIR